MWTPLPPGLFHDDGVYLLLGRSLAHGDGLRYQGVPGAPGAPKFPPVYPLVSALVWLVAGDPFRAARVLSLLNVVFTALAALAVSVFAERSLRLPRTLALAAAALTALSVDLWRLALVPLSEPLYVLLLLAALWAAARAERAESGGWSGAVLVGVVLLLVHVRTAGIAVALAAVIGLWWRGHRTRAVGVGAAILAGCLPWVVWSSSASRTIPTPLLDILGPYGPWLADQVLGAPRVYGAGLPGAAVGVVRRCAELLVPGAHPWAWWPAAGALGVAVIAGGHDLFRRTPTAALALGLSLALAWLWPFLDRRMAVPLLPLLLLSLACFADVTAARLRSARAGAAAGSVGASRPARRADPWILGALGLWALGLAGVSAAHLAEGVPRAAYEIRAAQLADALAAMRGRVPDSAVVGAPELWPALHLIAGVAAAPSARFRPVSPERDPVWGTPRQQLELWAAVGMDHLVIEDPGQMHGPTLDLLERSCPGAVRVLDVRPGAVLVRLDWDAACRRVLGLRTGVV